MEFNNNNFNNPQEKPILPEKIDTSLVEKIEYVPKFNHIKEDMKYMFGVDVEKEEDLSTIETKNMMYEEVVKHFNEGSPFALDYMFEEGLLTKEDLNIRGIASVKPQALKILQTFKGPRLTSAKNLFINVGILTEEEVNMLSIRN